MRDQLPETYNWHFVDIPLADGTYDADKHCKPSEKGDCVVAELERLKTELRCAPTDEQKRDALRYAVHFIGDIHQPLHTVDEARGGNDIAVDVRLAGAKTCTSGPCLSRHWHAPPRASPWPCVTYAGFSSSVPQRGWTNGNLVGPRIGFGPDNGADPVTGRSPPILSSL